MTNENETIQQKDDLNTDTNNATVNNEEQTVNEEQTAETAEAELTVEQKLEAAEEKIAELNNALLYKAAEFENYRKRTIKEKAELILNGGEKTIIALLPVLDDLERAMQHINTATEVSTLREGVELIINKLNKTLADQGLSKIDTKEAEFTTDLHEAIAFIPAPTDELKGKVIDCTQAGYKLNDKVIRYAKVAVGQ
ncbi:MAG: nucleotide exchange factor GrpE [Bacteroidaceae bacterium]|nr:nucleotide exchange factor GrpE [Bacteroidaceae bacterium]